MVTNLHERKFKTIKNSFVNQKTKLRGNLHVDFQREGQLKFFDVVGSFFLAHWIFYWHWKKILVSNFSQVTIFTQIVHVYDPRHLEWASLSESLSSRLFSGVIQPQHFGFFKPPVLSEVLVGIHSLHWETMFGIRQNPIRLFSRST